jgi:hypothetical protein
MTRLAQRAIHRQGVVLILDSLAAEECSCCRRQNQYCLFHFFFWNASDQRSNKLFHAVVDRL